MEMQRKVGTRDIAASLSVKYPHLTTDEIEKGIKTIFKRIAKGVSVGERTEIRGFGSFKTVVLDPGTKRNPSNGDTVSVGHRGKTHFRPGKELKQRVNVNQTGSEA
ncbi:HU family DNA-binding protein [Vibrio sp. 10N.261.46.E12]|uniref:HU family DNA-binding protein n=1 Tax=unclassified Vibrio TaxID=2614977 RepID=UPI0009FA6542|nr:MULTISPECIES: HU family DNA-binding protein [unclassified Vibrio]